MLQQIITIGRNTFIESVRQPIFVVLFLLGGLMLVMAPSLTAYTLEDDNKMLVDVGLSTILVCGLVLSAFTAASVLSNEIENRTVLTVVSKPVSRPVFIVGKFGGVAAAIMIAFMLLSVVFLLTVRHRVMQTASDPFDLPVIVFGGGGFLAALVLATAGNYFYRWVWTSSMVLTLAWIMPLSYVLVLLVNKQWQFQGIGAEFQDAQLSQLMIGIFLVLQAVLLFAAVAVACSTRLGQVMTLIFCVGFFFLGMISDYLFGSFADESMIAFVLYRLVPNVAFFWPADAISNEHEITWKYVGMVTIYAAACITAVLGIAVALFQNREVG